MNTNWMRTSVPFIALLVVAGPLNAQLRVGGQSFDAGSTSTSQDNDSSEQVTSLEEVQLNLTALGFNPGAIDGTETVETAIAISQFQSANDLDVTGKISPELAELLEDQVQAMRSGTVVQEGAVSSASMAGSASEQAESECVRETTDEAANQTRSASRLARATAGLLNRFGGNEVAQDINQAANTANSAANVASAAGALTDCE